MPTEDKAKTEGRPGRLEGDNEPLHPKRPASITISRAKNGYVVHHDTGGGPFIAHGITVATEEGQVLEALSHWLHETKE